MNRALFLVVFILIFPVTSATDSNDFSDSIDLESGIMVSGYVTESDGDNPQDLYKIQVSEGDTIEVLFTSPEADFCVYMGPNGSQVLDCYYEGELGNAGDISLFKRENTDFYYFTIDCGSTALDCSPSTRYTLKVIIYPDEAGDSLEKAVELLPETRKSGLAAVNEDAEPIDFDYFRTPVIENDVLRIVISSNDMTSYRMYDKYGIKIGGEYEAGNYDFSLNIDYTGELFIEIFCVLNAGEPCEYSLIVIGSTYVNSSINSQKSENKFFTNILTNLPYMLMALLIGFSILFVFFSKKRKRPIFSIQQNTETQNADNEIYRLKQTVIQAEIEKARIQNELEKAKETSIVQNITYNIQDSAISGDFNTSLGKSYEQ